MDRLSCLPDELICHILSFIRTKCSVQTSILSKRWRFLWAYVPILEFHIDDTVNSEIITKIVLQHQHDIHTFCLNFNGDFDGCDEEFESWIVNITTRNIHNLVIRLDDQFDLPQCLFTCKTLVDLLLIGCGDIPTSGIYFPVLKKLKLHHVLYESHESLGHLISSCPVLEELSIEGSGNVNCWVSSPTLIRLDLLFYNDIFLIFGLKLDTPALRYLRLQSYMPEKFSVGALDSLIEADITLYWDGVHQDNFSYSHYVLALVGKLYNVKILTLCTNGMPMIYDTLFSGFAIKFHNLTRLVISSNLGFITCFLENANNLQDLELDMLNIDNERYWMEPEQVPACLQSHLRIVKLCDFGCSNEEFDMVRYILMNAKVLKRMEIYTHLYVDDWEKKLEAIHRLSLFQRGSQECQVVFDGYCLGVDLGSMTGDLKYVAL